MLNRTKEINKYTICPYVHSFSNIPSQNALLRAVQIPDVRPGDLPPSANFSLVAGDCEEIYGMDEEKEPGGVWINLGALLWRFENNTSNDASIELDLEEVKELARKIGFDIKEDRTIDTTYVNNKEGMLGYVYHASFSTATKRI